MNDDHGDWLHEVKRDKALDERRCEICIHYRAGHQSALVTNPIGPYCAIERPLVPCGYFDREVGSDDDEQPGDGND